MNSTVIIKQSFIWLLYVAAQVLLARNFILFDKAFCFIYIGFILSLPLGIGRIQLLLLAFVTGFFVDIFYDSLGMHTAATVTIAYLRPSWITLITPRGGYENVDKPSLKDLSLSWYLTYGLPLVFIHQLILLFIEAGGFQFFFFTLWKVLFSTFLTVLMLIIVQYLFYSKGRYL